MELKYCTECRVFHLRFIVEIFSGRVANRFFYTTYNVMKIQAKVMVSCVHRIKCGTTLLRRVVVPFFSFAL